MNDRISGEQLDHAVARSGLKKVAVADLLGVSRAQLYKYLEQGISISGKVERAKRVLGLWLRDDAGNPFDQFSDANLIRELETRLSEARQRGSGT